MKDSERIGNLRSLHHQSTLVAHERGGTQPGGARAPDVRGRLSARRGPTSGLMMKDRS